MEDALKEISIRVVSTVIVVVIVLLLLNWVMKHTTCACGGPRGGQPIQDLQTQAAQKATVGSLSSMLIGFDIAK